MVINDHLNLMGASPLRGPMTIDLARASRHDRSLFTRVARACCCRSAGNWSLICGAASMLAWLDRAMKHRQRFICCADLALMQWE